MRAVGLLYATSCAVPRARGRGRWRGRGREGERGGGTDMTCAMECMFKLVRMRVVDPDEIR